MEYFRREMQSGGRHRHRSSLARIDGLVTISVSQIVGTMDVGREWDMANPLEDFKEPLFPFKANTALAKLAAGNDLGKQFTFPAFTVIAKPQELPYSYLSTGTNQTLPFGGVLRNLPSKQDFHFAFQELP
jgi:hypothetical protein